MNQVLVLQCELTFVVSKIVANEDRSEAQPVYVAQIKKKKFFTKKPQPVFINLQKFMHKVLSGKKRYYACSCRVPG
jgi:hypothetical protein